MKVIKWIDKYLEEILLALLLIGIAAIMVIQVAARYVFNNSLTWSDELARFMLVWSCFLSTSFCIKKHISISIDQLQNAFPGRIPTVFKMVSYAIICAYSIIMIPYSCTYLQLTVKSGAVSSALLMPMYYIQSAPFVGFILMTIRSVQAFLDELNYLRSGHKTEEGDRHK